MDALKLEDLVGTNIDNKALIDAINTHKDPEARNALRELAGFLPENVHAARKQLKVEIDSLKVDCDAYNRFFATALLTHKMTVLDEHPEDIRFDEYGHSFIAEGSKSAQLQDELFDYLADTNRLALELVENRINSDKNPVHGV